MRSAVEDDKTQMNIRRGSLPLADFIVIGVMSRGYLQCPCSEGHIYVRVCNDWDLPVTHGNFHILTHESFKSLILIIDRYISK